MPAPKRQLTKQQAVMVMTSGGILLALAIFIPVEPGTTAQYIKLLVGAIGFCMLAAGSYYRPMKPKAEEAAK